MEANDRALDHRRASNEHEPSLDIVVVNYRTARDLDYFFAALGTSGLHWVSSVSVVNVCPDQLDVEVAERNLASVYHDVPSTRHIVFDERVGYGTAVNFGGVSSTGTAMAIFNADVRMSVLQMFLCAQKLDKSTGVLGPRQRDRNGLLTHCGADALTPLTTYRDFHEPDTGQYRAVLNADRVSGSAMFIPRASWRALTQCPGNPSRTGPFLETPLYYEDTWLCAHAKMHGFQVIYDGTVTCEHDWHSSIDAGERRGDFSSEQLGAWCVAALGMYDTAIREHDGCCPALA